MTAETILYPHTEGGWPLCSGCFRHRSDTAHAIDPRTGTLDLLCGDCYRALAARNSPAYPTGEDLIRTWHRLARLHQNHEISDEGMDVAFRYLPPAEMPREEVGEACEVLKDALLRLQDAEDPSTVLDIEATGPDFDAETYCNHLHGCVADAVNKLIGRP